MRFCRGLLVTIFHLFINEFARKMPKAKGLRKLIQKITAREIK
jgi:hypothetical protein